ncbi:MAG: ATP-binding protein [Candidatus Omnitrophota bacterium]
MTIKLPWKLTFIFCLAVAAGVLAGYFYLADHLKTYLEDNLKKSIQNELILARDIIESHITSKKNFSDADVLADRIGKELNLRVTITLRDGTVVGDSNLSGDEFQTVENHINRPEIQEALTKGLGMDRRYSMTVKKYLLYIAMPFEKEKISGVLRLAMPLSHVEFLESSVKKIIVISLVLVFVFSLGFTFLTSFFISKPLVEMAGIARAMARGDFSRKPSVYSQDEIGELSKALTHMSGEIKEKIEIIEQEKIKLDAVLSSMFEGIMVVDEKGKILMINPSLQKLFFIDASPEHKKPLEVIRHRGVQETVDQILSSQSPMISKEIIIEQPEEIVFKINAAAIIRNHQLQGAVLVFHDLTELRRLEKIRQDFVANVSHELRTPVASIKGYAETLLSGALDDQENRKEFVHIIHQDSIRLANLINDLLDLSGIESGKMNMVFLSVDIHPTVKLCLNVLEKAIKAKNISVQINIASSLPKAKADEQRLSQVFLNLLDNAVKYTPQDGSIQVNAQAQAGHIRVDIIDNGIGIAENDLPRIFERFYRTDKARSRELGGTGLGLSIVKHIVLAHGGEVFVQSMPGQGSTFSFTIPQA